MDKNNDKKAKENGTDNMQKQQEKDMRSLECAQFSISSRPDYINIKRKREKTNTTAREREKERKSSH